MILRYVTGDLFNAPTEYALAHCISADAVMGAGIAAQFTRRIPTLREAVRRYHPLVGDCIAISAPPWAAILNLVTKCHVWEKPTLNTLRVALVSMANTGQRRIAMPYIGCGIDGLRWPDVETILRDVFADTDVELVVYTLGRNV